MESDYCRIKIHKRFFKCISVNDGKCYLMLGRNEYIHKIIKTIIDNFHKEKDILENISDEEIILLYDYISTKETTKLPAMKKYLEKIFDLEEYRENISFVVSNTLLADFSNWSMSIALQQQTSIDSKTSLPK